MLIDVEKQTSSVNDTVREVRAVAALLADFAGPWAFCGGWAIHLFLDRQTREHKDVDVAIARRDQLQMQAYLATRGWHLQVAHEGVLTDWQPGKYLELPRQGIWGRHPSARPDFLELLLNEIEDDPEGGGPVFRFRRDQTITRSLDAAIVRATSGLPILAPEIALLYKSNALDEANRSDFRAALPALGPDRRDWLGAALARLSPAHPWLDELTTHT
jgi:hypothetical protein